MRKFTAFTIILTVVVVVVLAEIFVNDYLPDVANGQNSGIQGLDLNLPTGIDSSKGLSTSVLGSDLGNKLGSDLNPDLTTDSTASENESYSGEFLDMSQISGDFLPVQEDTAGPASPLGFEDETSSSNPPVNSNESAVSDFEDQSYKASSSNVYIREEQLRSAGFIDAYLADEDHSNTLFKTIPLNDLYDTEIQKFAVRTQSEVLAKVYVFKVGIQADVDEVYQLIKLRSSESTGVTVNETNQYGSSSFYMNDPTRENTAFLTVRLGGLIYSFSYPKDYHPQIKNLIKLLEWEI